MTKRTSIRTLAATAALLVCSGCSGAVEQDSRELWTVGGAPGDQHQAAPSSPSPSETEHAGVTLGKLRSSFSSAARSDVCITLAADGRVEAMDEYFCEALSDEAANCGGCLMEYRAARDGNWMLAAQPGLETCAVFAGIYRLVGAPSERAASCVTPVLTPCGDGYCKGECGFGPHDIPVCVEAE